MLDLKHLFFILALLIATKCSAFSSEYWVGTAFSTSESKESFIIAVSKTGNAVYFVGKNKDGKIISSPGNLTDNDFGPNLSNASIEINVAPLSVNLNSTSYGQSVRILRKGKLITLADIKQGIFSDGAGNFMASVEVDNIDFLPKNKDDYNKFNVAIIEKASGIKAKIDSAVP